MFYIVHILNIHTSDIPFDYFILVCSLDVTRLVSVFKYVYSAPPRVRTP